MVVAKIEAIDLNKPWYYTACNFCKRKMARQGDGFEGNVQHLQHNPIYNCKTCNKDFEHAIHWYDLGFFSYYLVVRVSDDSKGEAKFLLFNNIAEMLIRRPAFELVQEAAQEIPHFLPQSLTDLIGRKLLFKITIGTYGQQEQNSAYVVDLVIDDADIIQHFDPHTYYVDAGTNDKENTPMGNITLNSSIKNVSPLPNGLTHQARAARKEILNNKRTIGLTTSNRGPYNSTQSSPTLAKLSGSGINMHPSSTIGNQETISRSTSISLRKRKTLGSPPSVNSKTRQKEARQGPNMTRQTNPTLPAVCIADAPPKATQSPLQQTKTNEFIPPPRFIVEDHPEAYNNRYEMESESENENEDEENQTYTTYPAGESLINPSPQHIPQQTNNTVTSPIIIGIQKNGYYDDGDPGWNCTFCQAYMWYGERIGKRRRSSNPVFTMCCKRDHSINNGRGPFVFQMSGENYHRSGDIVPEPGQAPKFSQLYIIDTLNEIKNRLDAYAGSDRAAAKKLREPLVLLLKNMLDQCNPHVKAFRSARERFDVEGSTGYRMRLIESRQSDGRTHNLPTANEVAALIPGDFVLNMETRDIVLESTSGKLQRISELHPAYLPLQYPLLFPFGEDGFRLNIPIGFEDSTARKRKNVTMREYFAFRILERRWEAPTITRSGRLFHQFLVDAYTMIESSRLRYLWMNQKKLRSSSYAAIQKAATRAGAKMAEQGTRIFIPATFNGGKSDCSSATYAMKLFARMLVSKSFSQPHVVWEATWEYLTDDILYKKRRENGQPDMNLTIEKIKNIALTEIENHLLSNGCSLKKWPHMPKPEDFGSYNGNRLIDDDLKYVVEDQLKENERLMAMITDEQRGVYEQILDAVLNDSGGVFFLYGYGGTGKTFVYRALSSAIRSRGMIVLNTASSGIAALLLEGGRTAHSRFGIP
ncbi:unnamed protein product, partial [Brassica napus]